MTDHRPEVRELLCRWLLLTDSGMKLDDVIVKGEQLIIDTKAALSAPPIEPVGLIVVLDKAKAALAAQDDGQRGN